MMKKKKEKPYYFQDFISDVKKNFYEVKYMHLRPKGWYYFNITNTRVRDGKCFNSIEFKESDNLLKITAINIIPKESLKFECTMCVDDLIEQIKTWRLLDLDPVEEFLKYIFEKLNNDYIQCQEK